MELYYKQYGEGQPLIILHGLLGASGNWHTLASKEFNKSHSVFAVDLRNHGKSPHHARMDYEVMSEDVAELIETCGLGPSNVLGHSMGGKVAMQLALGRPEFVSRLVVVDVAPRAYEDRHRYIIEALRSVELERITSRDEIEEALAAHIPSLPVRQFLLKNLRYNPNDGYSWLMNLDAIDESYAQIAGAITIEGEYQGPALFIRGGQSDYLGKEDEQAIQKIFPAARFETIEDAGHWVHAEAPSEFASHVLEFLSQ